MKHVFILLVFFCSPHLFAAHVDDLRIEYQTRLAESSSVGELRSLGSWAQRKQLYDEAKECFKKVLEIDTDDKSARKALGYRRHKGEWISNDVYYEEKGYVKHLGRWMSKSSYKSAIKRLEKVRKKAAFHRNWENAWEIKTKHFTIRSNASYQVVEEAAFALELCLHELQKTLKMKRTIKNIPIDIYNTQDEFMRHSVKAGIPVSPGVLGYFYWGRGSGIRAFYAGSIEQTLSTIFHEVTHLILNKNIGENIPIWFNEGLAVYIEDSRREEKGLNVHAIPFRRLYHLRRLMKAGDLSLNELVRIEFGYTIEYYPQGWAFLHFLIYGPYQKQFARFYNNLKKQKGTDNIKDFIAAFGKEPDELNEEWYAYIKNLKAEDLDDMLGEAEVALEFSQFDKCESLTERVLKEDGKDWQGYALKGRLYVWKSLYANEGVLFSERDIEKDSNIALENLQRALDIRGRKMSKKKSGMSQLFHINLYLDTAKAAILAGAYDDASDLIEIVLDSHPYTARAYAMLGYLHTVALNKELRNLKEAQKYLEIASDLGRDHETMYFESVLLRELGEDRRAGNLLRQAAGLDRFGTAGSFYRNIMQKGKKTRIVGREVITSGTSDDEY